MEMTQEREGAILERAQALCKMERMAPSPYYGKAWNNARDHVLRKSLTCRSCSTRCSCSMAPAPSGRSRELERLADRLRREGFDCGAD